MKKIFFLAVFLFTLQHNLFAEIDCWKHIKVKKGEGNKIWDNVNRFCISSGMNCIIVPCEYPSSIGTIELLPNGDYLLKSSLSSIKIQYKEDDNWTEIERNGNNYSFSELEILIIDECDEYPELVGREIELNGISTDNDGNFEVIIPA